MADSIYTSRLRQFGLTAYWFGQSYKWFILLLAVLPGQVAELVPDGKNATWGTIFSIAALWAIVGPALFGHISDRFGRRKPFIAIGVGVTVIALALLADAGSLWVLIGGYLLLQIGDDVASGSFQALIPQSVPPELRGRTSGAMGVMQLTGQIASALVGLALGSVLMIYVGIALVNIVAATITILNMREGEKTTPTQGLFAGYIAPFRNADFAWVWATRFIVMLGFYAIEPQLRYYLEDAIGGVEINGVKSFLLFGQSVGDSGDAVIVIGLSLSFAGAIGALVAGRYVDSWSRKRLVALSGVVMAVAMIPFALVRDYSAIWVISILFGAFYGVYLAADWALASDAMPSKGELGKDMGIWTSCIPAAQLVSGAVFGRLIGALNQSGGVFGYTVAIWAAGACFFVGSVFVGRVRGSY